LHYSSVNKKYLENEKVQSYMRIVIIVLVIINLLYLHYFSEDPLLEERVQKILPYPFIAFFIASSHLYFLYRYPQFYQKQRIILIGVFDVSATIFIMYLAGELSVYYSVLLLWVEIGYGMRYGVTIGYVVYASVLLAWSLLLYSSEFWHHNLDMGLGWLIAYAVIPLYFFKLVKALQQNIVALHKEVDSSNFKALHDPLTNLPNRIYLNETLEFYITEKEAKFALVFIDLDGFKEINDSLGHEIGDAVLIEVARRIATLESFSSRLGGDEFVSLVKFKKKDELEEKLKKLMDSMNKECFITQTSLSASVGVALYPEDAITAYDLKKRADLAMYKAKEEGKNRFVYFSKALLRD